MPELARDTLLWGEEVDHAREALGYRSARDAIFDPRGWTVRCTPMRRTVRIGLEGGVLVFAKHRMGVRPGDAAVAEWQALRRVVEFGFGAPRRVFVARFGSRSVIGSELAPGRPADVVIGECVQWGGEAGRAAVLDWIRTVVGPRVRAMHDAGVCYRDLYWNHVFVESNGDHPTSFRAGAVPTLIDAERLFSPGRMRRWIVKDLAGLASSWPAGADPAPVVEICEAVGRGEWVADVERKSEAIRSHQPKFG